MSKTPRTDAKVAEFHGSDTQAFLDYTRLLEQELNEMQTCNNTTQRINIDLVGKMGQLRAEIEKLKITPSGFVKMETMQAALERCDAWQKCAERLAEAINKGLAHGYGLRIGDEALAEFENLNRKGSDEPHT